MQSAPAGSDAAAKIISEHTERIKTADAEIRAQLRSLSFQVRFAVWVSLFFSIVLFLAVLLLLNRCLNVLLANSIWAKADTVSLAGAGIGLVMLSLLLQRNPVRLVRQSILIISSLNLVYLNFTRQLSQADARFCQMVMQPDAFDQEEFQVIVLSIQATLEESLGKIRKVMDESE